jgi:putative transposase
MVRAGVVKHPQDWPHGGYHEIQGNKRRNTILDMKALQDLLELNSPAELRHQHRQRVDEMVALDGSGREGKWTESIAVGGEDFVRRTQDQLNIKVKKREIREEDGIFML